MEILVVDFFNFFSRLSFLIRSSYQFTVIKWILVIYSVAVILATLLLAYRYPQIMDYSFRGNKSKKRIEKKKKTKTKTKVPQGPWDQAKAKLNSVNPNDWKIAVIEADKLLATSLETANIEGVSVGDKLKNLVAVDVDNELDKIWEAHKTRNNIVHDPGFELTNDLARKSVMTLEKASKMLAKK